MPENVPAGIISARYKNIFGEKCSPSEIIMMRNLKVKVIIIS